MTGLALDHEFVTFAWCDSELGTQRVTKELSLHRYLVAEPEGMNV